MHETVRWWDWATPRPLIKMPGSKRWLVPILQESPIWHYAESPRRIFHEPFAGSAVLSLSFCGNLLPGQVHISDLNVQLMNLYAVTAAHPDLLHEELLDLVTAGVDEDTYYKIRDSEPPDNPVQLAARTLYLARLGFNGLWRVNRSGKFNVPYGQQKTKSLPCLNALGGLSSLLKSARIYAQDFRRALETVGCDDIVYADPPYYGTFTSYTTGKFSYEDAIELANTLKALARDGTTIIVSSPGDPKILELYEPWCETLTVPVRHRVAANAAMRRVFQETIYTNRPDLITLNKNNTGSEK